MRSRTRALVAAGLVAGLALAGCRFGEPDNPDLSPPWFGTPSPVPRVEAPPQLTEVHEVLVTDLAVPWGIAFLPDGAALVTERDSGRVLRVGPESDAGGPQVTEVQTIDVDPAGEGGLLGIAVSPEYETDGWVFAYHSTGTDNRIVRFTLGGEPEPVRTGLPYGEVHNGGALAFGPDGYLYATTGDAGAPDRARDPVSLAGAILRMTVDGEPAPDNPYHAACGGPDQEPCGEVCGPDQVPCEHLVYAYGLRDPQGLAWDEHDRLWATDLGGDDWDELNLIEAGGNYGWPDCAGPCDPRDPALADPVVTWLPVEAGCAGVAAVGRALVAACLHGQRLWVMELTMSGTVLGAPRPLLVEQYGRLRTVVDAPDGSLWVTTSNLDGGLLGGPRDGDDRIVRLVVAGASGAGQL